MPEKNNAGFFLLGFQIGERMCTNMLECLLSTQMTSVMQNK